MEKSHFQKSIDDSIDRFYDKISSNIEMLPGIPKDKGLLILNELLSYACDASNQMLIDHSMYLIKKIPCGWFGANVREAVGLDSDEAWCFDLDDPYVFDRLICVLKQMNCGAYAKELTDRPPAGSRIK